MSATFLPSILCKQKICICCGKKFYVCQKCDKGQVYCSDECRKAGYLERHREAQKKYQSTKKGKKTRNDAANRRRYGGKKYTGKFRTILQTCICRMMSLICNKTREKKDNEHRAKCSICGVEGILVENFPGRL